MKKNQLEDSAWKHSPRSLSTIVGNASFTLLHIMVLVPIGKIDDAFRESELAYNDCSHPETHSLGRTLASGIGADSVKASADNTDPGNAIVGH